MNAEEKQRRVRRPELPAEVFAALHRVLAHLWADEERRFFERHAEGTGRALIRLTFAHSAMAGTAGQTHQKDDRKRLLTQCNAP